MGTLSSIEDLLAERKKDGRKSWFRAIIGIIASAALSIGGTTWKVRGYVDELEHQLADQKRTLDYLHDHLPEVEKIAIDARGDAQATTRALYAHLGGWPPGVK